MKYLNTEQQKLLNYIFYNRELVGLDEESITRLTHIFIKSSEPISEKNIEFLNMIRTKYIDTIIRR